MGRWRISSSIVGCAKWPRGMHPGPVPDFEDRPQGFFFLRNFSIWFFNKGYTPYNPIPAIYKAGECSRGVLHTLSCQAKQGHDMLLISTDPWERQVQGNYSGFVCHAHGMNYIGKGFRKTLCQFSISTLAFTMEHG